MNPTRTAARIRHLVAAIVAVALAAAALAAVQAPASAANASDFEPGNIIADSKFYDGDAMTVAEISSFLKSMNDGCLAGEKCILNYTQSAKAISADPMCKALGSASNITAAQAIYRAGKACGVSQKALLVILQKEQSLITDRAATTRQLNYAMGYGCPDTAPCDPAYAGLFIQIYKAAWALKRYTMPPGTGAGTDWPTDYGARYPVGKTTNILYNPKSSCGTKPVFIENQATHALYVYTPYTPNAAALKNLYGTGDSCSAYGNRNFWRMYTDWFGPSGAIGAAAIGELYQSMGGASSYLGTPVGEPVATNYRGGGLIQEYTGGKIAWNNAYGAHALTPAFVTKWEALGGVAGVGWPTSDIVQKTNASGTGKWQRFQTCLVVWTSGAGTFRVHGAYQRALEDAGSFDGVLGWPTADVANSAQRFRGATIVYDSASARTDLVDNKIAPAYLAAGGPAKWGRPTAAMVSSASGVGGVFQDFAKGRVVIATSRPALVVYGSYLEVWKSAGNTAGPLGWPTGAPFTDEASGYRAQAFDGGTVYIGALGKGYVGSAFAEKVAAAGGVTGKYGFPSSGVRTTSTGQGQDFKGWTLVVTDEAGLKSLSGSVRNAWIAAKAEKGFLGWPVSQASVDANKVSSARFEGGTIFTQGTKKALVGEHFVDTLAAAGGVTGRYGWPTSQLIKSSKNGGGEAQKFATIVLTWNAERGNLSVWGTLKDPWYSYSAYAGPLGWPTGLQKTDPASKARYQDFVGGRLYVLSSKKGYVATGLVAAYAESGGPSGAWGWPAGAPQTAEGVTTQLFDKGTATLAGETVTFTAK